MNFHFQICWLLRKRQIDFRAPWSVLKALAGGDSGIRSRALGLTLAGTWFLRAGVAPFTSLWQRTKGKGWSGAAPLTNQLPLSPGAGPFLACMGPMCENQRSAGPRCEFDAPPSHIPSGINRACRVGRKALRGHPLVSPDVPGSPSSEGKRTGLAVGRALESRQVPTRAVVRVPVSSW